ncbi:RNA polymerase sigma factor [Pedobacter deserti]|uniref:RNA polymerase sigma factor n=1 Tax=Pedobacter deserti TaxID=2817382 RepID=UPI00210C9521|nr:sigma-70 family RNA polymerase sigma factor [Pedobacter sp. SYSU D00382]
MNDYKSYNDYELCSMFVSGDDRAFREIYIRYDKPLYLYAYHKVGNKEESRDLVQDVFAWMLANRTRLDLNTTLSGYLYKSVLNKIYNLYKHKGVKLKYSEDNPFNDQEATGTDFLIREKDIRVMIAQSIAAMPPRMREIYELRSNQYMTAKQISEYLQIAEGTVTTQLKRAFKHLRLRIGGLMAFFGFF